MNLQELETKTGLPRRTLRYVLEHDVIPELTYQLDEFHAGRPRVFTPEVGIAIALAASLIEAGLKREIVRRVLYQVTDRVGFGKATLRQNFADLIHGRAPTTLLIADGKFVRVRAKVTPDYDSDWLPLEGKGKAPAGYDPLALVTFELGRLMEQFPREPAG